MQRYSRRSSRDVGQSLVEFAMVLPILAILVFGIIDFGMGLRAYITVAQGLPAKGRDTRPLATPQAHSHRAVRAIATARYQRQPSAGCARQSTA